MCGRDVSSLTEVISGQHSLFPYCDVSLRVLIRLADALQSRHFLHPCDIRIGEEDKVDMLKKHHTDLYTILKHQEMDIWVDKPNDFFSNPKWVSNYDFLEH